jgi:hypothetical protein
MTKTRPKKVNNYKMTVIDRYFKLQILSPSRNILLLTNEETKKNVWYTVKEIKKDVSFLRSLADIIPTTASIENLKAMK